MSGVAFQHLKRPSADLNIARLAIRIRTGTGTGTDLLDCLKGIDLITMSKFDGSSEKQKDGSDSAAFKGKRHPFLDRGVDWNKIEKKRYGMEGDQLIDSADVPAEIEITGLDEKTDRIEKCVAAVKQLYTNPDMWYRIRDCLIEAYRSAGPKQKASRKALRVFTEKVNKRLGSSGEIFVDRAIGLQAREIAKVEGVSKPDLSAHVSVRHSGGLMGPIGVCFTNKN